MLVAFLFGASLPVFSQEKNQSVVKQENPVDSVKKSGAILYSARPKPAINLTKSQSIEFLQKKVNPEIWYNSKDPLRQAFAQLIFEAEHQPVDSMERKLRNYRYDSLSVPWDKFFTWEQIRLKIPVLREDKPNIPGNVNLKSDSSNFNLKNDSARLISLETAKALPSLKDTTIMVLVDTLKEVRPAFSGSPIKYFNQPYQSDSIKAAVETLLNYLDARDSMIIGLTGNGKNYTPIMLNSRSEREIRFWLKNDLADSVTVWIGNPARNSLSLYLEKGVAFRRPSGQRNWANANVNSKPVDKSKLLDIKNIKVKTEYWKYRTEAAFVLNQASLSNWVKGGESSISTALDMTGYADYNNKPLKISSSNFARFNFGYIASGSEGLRKNLDLLETNSKFNHKAFGKFDFSAILLFKTQAAVGKNFLKAKDGSDSIVRVSKFMNPAIITVGLGLDYKPDKNTSINFSPLSYKGTFVTDPAYMNNTFYPGRIDQTLYGIEKNKKSLNEPGVSFMISNEFKPIPTVSVINRLQLFTNYIHNPQNVDVDWEMIATAKLNWFTDVRLNTHLIYDDDTKTDKVVNGVVRKSARIQFKELLGFSLSFKF